MNPSQNSNRMNLIRTGADGRRSLWRNNVALLLALSILIFLLPVLPVIPMFDQLLTRIVLVLIVVSGLFAAELNRRIFRILSSLGLVVVLVTVSVIFFDGSKILTIISFFLNTLFFIIVSVALVSHVSSAKKVDASTLLCAINSYLLIGITATLLFVILDTFAPASFAQMEADKEDISSFIYFGFVTLTTLGYGDISPATPLARSLTTFTVLTGQLYLVIIMAFIIGKFLNTKASDQDLK